MAELPRGLHSRRVTLDTPFRLALQSPLLRSAVAGGGATAFLMVLLYLFVDVAGQPEVASSMVAFTIAHATNYLLQYHFAFRSTRGHRSALMRFLAVSALTLTLNYVLYSWLVGLMHYMLAQALTIGVIFVVNFFLNRHFAFAPVPDRAREGETPARDPS